MSREQLVQALYARWLGAVTGVAFAAALVSFVLYAGGILPSFVPLDALPSLWHLPVAEYLARTGEPTGWGWLRLLAYADYLSLACVALIAAVTLVCYLAVLPMLLRLGERTQAVLVAAQVIVLLFACSGALAAGH
ncbi:MAG TPA: hypothetical protein VGF58_22995 [Burkholderiales bacterium]